MERRSNAQTGQLTMTRLLELLADELIFFLDPFNYRITDSGGTASGDGFIDLQKRELIWRLVKSRGQISLDLRLQSTPEYPAYSADILKRWHSKERDDSTALLSEDLVVWLRSHLGQIEDAIENDRDRTIADWEALKVLRTEELFG